MFSEENIGFKLDYIRTLEMNIDQHYSVTNPMFSVKPKALHIMHNISHFGPVLLMFPYRYVRHKRSPMRLRPLPSYVTPPWVLLG